MERHNLHLCERPTTFSTTRKHNRLFRLQCILLCYVSFRVYPFGRLCQDQEHDARQWDRKTVMISQVLFLFFSFFCLPAFSRNYMHGDEHSPSGDPACHCRSCRQWNKYSTSLLYGRNLILCKKKKKCDFDFLHVALCCTVL